MKPGWKNGLIYMLSGLTAFWSPVGIGQDSQSSHSPMVAIQNEAIDYAIIYTNPNPEIAGAIDDFGKEALLVGDVVAGIATQRAYAALRRRVRDLGDQIVLEKANLANLTDVSKEVRTLDLVDEDGDPLNEKAARKEWKRFVRDMEYEQKPLSGPKKGRTVTLMLERVLDDGRIDVEYHDDIKMTEANKLMKDYLTNGNRTRVVRLGHHVPAPLNSSYADLSSKDVRARTKARLRDISKSKSRIFRMTFKKRFLSTLSRVGFLPVLAATVAIGFFTATSTASFLEGVETLEAACADPDVLKMKAMGMVYEKQMSESSASSIEVTSESAINLQDTKKFEQKVDDEQAKIEEICAGIEG